MKMSILSNLVCKFKAINSKISARFLCRGKIILKYIWKHKGARRTNTILKIQNKLGGIESVNVYCVNINASAIKTV